VPAVDAAELTRVFREESGRVVVVASERWPATGLPPNPGGWIVTTARNRGIDRLRREASRADRQAAAMLLREQSQSSEPEPDVTDDRLLYDQLLAVSPSPVVALNRAVAVGELEGPGAALALVDPLAFGDYHLYHATRADLLGRLGRLDDARLAYARAIELTANEAERALLRRKCAALA
jgi:RNA polymerase sigma-70 factor (ECF subfamily)